VSRPLAEILSPEKALIFRITHRSNLRFILENGLFCRSANTGDPDFVTIGNPELIEKRRERTVDVSSGGTLDDYVPFYFTPRTPMLLNITTGFRGITQRKNEEIVILVSSLPALEANGVSYVFSDRHAYLKVARFFSDRADLTEAVDFSLLRSGDFHRDPEHPERFERFHAEALAHRFVPVNALLGVGCYTSAIQDEIRSLCSQLNVTIGVEVRPHWYFA
jgi:hypothetical protein